MRNWIDRAGVGALFLLAAALLSGGPSTHAQALAFAPEDYEKVLQWNAAWQEPYFMMMQAMEELTAAELAIDEFYNGGMERAAFDDAFSGRLAQARALINRAERLTNALVVPRLTGAAARELADSIHGMFPAFQTNLERTISVMEDLRRAAIAGDATAYNRLSAASIRLGAASIEAENVTLSAAVLAIPPNNPQFWLTRSFMSTNKALIVMSDAMAAVLEANAGQAAAEWTARSTQLAEHIEEGRSQLTVGRDMARRLRATEAALPLDLKPAFGALLDNFDSAFEVETKILDLQDDFRRSLTRIGSASATIDQAEVSRTAALFQIHLPALVDRRADLSLRRQKIGEEVVRRSAAQ